MVNLSNSLDQKEAENFEEISRSENVPFNNVEINSRKVDTLILNEPTVDPFTKEDLDNLREEQNMIESREKVVDENYDVQYQEEDSVQHLPATAPESYQESVENESVNDKLNASPINGHTASDIQTVLPRYPPKKEFNSNSMATNENKEFYFLNLNCQNSTLSSHFFDQLRNMFIERELLDCTLVCEDQCVKAHKLMLAAVSPYFRSIFNSFGNFGCNNTAIIVQNVPARDMKLIVKIIYSIDSDPIRLNLNRAISLRKSVYRLKIDFINEKLDQSGIPQLNPELILSLNEDSNLNNEQEPIRKRKRSHQDFLVNASNDKQTNQSSSESTDENSSEGSSSMKHLKYKHRYLLSNGHLAKCGNDAPQDTEMYDREEDLQIEEEGNGFENLNTINSNCQPEIKLNECVPPPKVSSHIENLNDFAQIKKSTLQTASRHAAYSNQVNALNDKELDLSMNNRQSNQEAVLKLVNAANHNNLDNNDKVANIYKAMKSEIKKLWTNNSDLACADSLNQYNNQFLNKSAQNNLANDIISQFYMAGANLNPETARALLFTNELLKNNAVNNNQLQHSINKHSAENSLNTSTSSTNSSIGNQQQTNSSSATAALVAAAQQQILNASYLNKTSSSNNNSVGKQNSITGALLNSSKSNRSLSSNSYNTQNSASSSNSSVNSSNGAPVKRGRGRPPRHTQPSNGSETNPANGDQISNSKPTPAQSKTLKQHSTSPSLSNITNLNNFNESTATTIADALNAFNQEKKWRPNLENLLALKMRKNKLSSSSAGTASPTNDIGQNSSLMQHSQSNLLTNGSLSKSSTTPNNVSAGNFTQNGATSISNNTSIASSTNGANGQSSASGNSTSSQNASNDGKNCCPVRTII